MQRKTQADQMKAQVDMQKAQSKDAIEIERIQSQEKIAESGLEQKLISDVIDARTKGDKITSEEATKAAEIAAKLASEITSGNNNGQK